MRLYLAADASVLAATYKENPFDFQPSLLITTDGPKDSRVRLVAKVCDILQPKHVFLDSGAFVLGSAYAKHGKKPTQASAEDLLERHVQASAELLALGYPVEAIAEFDLQALYGLEAVQDWRERYFFPFQDEHGTPVVFVPHGESPKTILDDPRVEYMGITASISSLRRAREDDSLADVISFYRDLAHLCYASGIKLHGFGITRFKLLRQIPFASVDSVTWQQAIHFGDGAAFDSMTGELTILDIGRGLVRRKGARVAASNVLRLQARGSKIRPLDAIGRHVVNGKPRADIKALANDQAHAFKEMEAYYTKLWSLKGVNWDARFEGADQEE